MPTDTSRLRVVSSPGHDEELAGLDSLSLDTSAAVPRARRAWSAAWPKLAAIAIALGVWQAVVWTHWRPGYVLPPPGPVFHSLWHDAGTALFWRAIGFTMRRAIIGYTLAVAVGLLVGGLVARSRVLRSAVGSLITGLQTMPSIAWFPLALLLFKLSESAITFVVVIGAAPSIANGFVAGVDHVPPLLVRSGRMLGARGIALWRHVIVPAALPSLIGGLKQGWAFAWRSLMAGELLVIIGKHVSIGEELSNAQNQNDAVGLLEMMLVILILGILVDALFGLADRRLRRRWGLTT
jgi:NitT/TauT family transport system permease protein